MPLKEVKGEVDILEAVVEKFCQTKAFMMEKRIEKKKNEISKYVSAYLR